MTSAREIIQASGIGASEVAAILGISPFGDAYTVLARKKGFGDPQPETEEQHWGKLLEPLIAGVFAHRENLPIEWWDKPVYSKKRDWQRASPDGLILSKTEPAERVGVLECKTTGPHYASHWDQSGTGADGIPEYYLVQVEWQMSTLELPVAHVAVLIAGQDFRTYRIEHDPILEEIILEQVEPFYFQCVLGDAEPPMGPSPHARNYIRQRYPKHTEKLRPAEGPEIEWLQEYASLRSRMDVLEDQKATLENQLCRAIGDAEGIQSANAKMTWKKIKDRFETNWEELAREQLIGYTDEEQRAKIQQYTETIHGYRKIHFRKNEDHYAGQTHRNR